MLFKKEPALFIVSLFLLIGPLCWPLLYYLSFIGIGFKEINTPLVLGLLFTTWVKVLVISYVLLLIKHPDYRPFFRTTHIWLIILGGILLVGALISPDPVTSFFGSARRADGLWLLAHLGLYLFIGSWLVRERRDWEFVLKIALMVGWFVILLIPLIIFLRPTVEINAGYWYQELGLIIGNPNFFVHYFLLLLLVNYYFLFTRARPRVVYILFILICGIVFVLTQSSSGSILFFILLVMSLWRLGKKIFYSALGLFAATGLWLTVIKHPLLNLLFSAAQSSFSLRFEVWKSAFATIMTSKPIWGFGWANNVIMWNQTSVDWATGRFSYLADMIFDKSHNQFLDYLSAGGVVLLAMVSMFWGWILIKSWRHYKQDRSVTSFFFCIAFGTNIIFLFFNFDTLMSYILTAALLIGWLIANDHDQVLVWPAGRYQWRSVLLLCGLVICLWWLVDYPTGRAWWHVHRSRQQLDFYADQFSKPAADVLPELARAEQVLRLNDLISLDIIETYNLALFRKPFSLAERRYINNRIIALYQRLIASHPRNPYYHYALANVYQGTQADFTLVENELWQAINLAPEKIMFRDKLAWWYLREQDYAAAESMINELEAMDYFPPKMNFFRVLIITAQSDEPSSWPQLVTSLVWYQPASDEWTELVTISKRQFGEEETLKLLQRLVVIGEPDINLYARLINELRHANRFDLADKYYETAVAKFPNQGYELFRLTARSTLKSEM